LLHICETAPNDASNQIDQLILEKGSKLVNNILPDGKINSPLQMAAFHGHVKIVDKLIKLGAKIDYGYAFDHKPIYLAAKNGHAEVIELLLKSDSQLLDKFRIKQNTHNPLHVAAHYGHVEAVETIIKLGVPIDIPNWCNQTPLMIAAINGQTEVIERLLSLGSEGVNMLDSFGQCPIDIALFNRYEASMLETLLRFCPGLTDRLFRYKNGFYPPVFIVAYRHNVDKLAALISYNTHHIDAIYDDRSLLDMVMWNRTRDQLTKATMDTLLAIGCVFNKTKYFAAKSQITLDLPEDEVAHIRYKCFFSRSLVSRLICLLVS
jgi:hypothetical protein